MTSSYLANGDIVPRRPSRAQLEQARGYLRDGLAALVPAVYWQALADESEAEQVRHYRARRSAPR